MSEIREKRGLTYSGGSHYTGMHAQGPFIIHLKTKNKSATEALNIVQTLIKTFIQKGPSTEQVELAKNHILGSALLQLSSNGSIVRQLGPIGFYNLPIDHLKQFYSEIASATQDNIRTIMHTVMYSRSLGLSRSRKPLNSISYKDGLTTLSEIRTATAGATASRGSRTSYQVRAWVV